MWSLFENTKLVLEALALAFIVLVFWLHPATQRVRRLPGLRHMVMAVTVFFVVEATAQITTRDQYKYPQKHEPFPFTRWAMFAGFTHSVDHSLIYDWRGLDAQGQASALNPARLFVTPNSVVLFTKTNALGDQVPSDGQPVEPSVKSALDAFAEGLLTRHNQMNPERPILRIELWRRTLPLQRGAVVPAPFTAPGSAMIYSWSPLKS